MRLAGGMAGLTIIELLVSFAIMLIIFLAAVAFFVPVFNLPAFQLEQGRIVTTARVQVERMSDLLQGGTIVAADFNDITVLKGGDRIRYWVQGTSLRKQVNGGHRVVVAKGIRNMTGADHCNRQGGAAPEIRDRCMFRFYSVGGEAGLELDPTLSGISYIARVSIMLIVDADGDQDPGEARVETMVTIR